MSVGLTDKITIDTDDLIGIIVTEVQGSENPYHVIALISEYGDLTLKQFDTQERAIAYKMNASECSFQLDCHCSTILYERVV